MVFKCSWLAKVIRGRSQHVSTSSGDEIESTDISMFVKFENSKGRFNHIKLIIAIMELFTTKWVHSHFGFASHVVGSNIMVGIKIFSIVEGLSF